MNPAAAACLACLLAGTAKGAAPAAAYVPSGPGGGGALLFPAVSPHDPRFLVVACDMGGVYRSGDGGASWTMIDKRQLRDAAAGPVIWHPAYGGWLWGAGAGSLKMSRDSGATWTPLCPNQPWGAEPVCALAVDGEFPRLMFAGSTFGAFRSTDGGKTWTACAGVRGRALGIVVDPTTPAAQRNIVIGTTEGVFRSADSGSRWQDSSAGLPSRALRGFCGAGDAKSGKVAFYATLPGRAVGGRFEGGIYRSLDHGTTWQSAMGTGLNTGISRVDEWGAGDVAQYGWIASPNSAPYTVYVTEAGTGYWPPNHTTIYRTDDGGASWRAIAFGDPRGEASGIKANIRPGWIAADHVWGWWGGTGGGVAVDARDPEHALFTNEGEIYRTRDGGGTWTQGYSRPVEPGDPWKEGARWATTGLDVTTCWDVAFDPRKPSRVLVGYTDIGVSASDDGGTTWRFAVDGSPWRNTFYQIAYDPATPGLVWAACSEQHDIPHWSNIEGPNGGGGVCVSRDSGMTWTPSGRGLPESPVTSVAVDPRSPAAARVLYAASFGLGVYRSDDGGRTWSPTPGQPGREGNRHAYRLLIHPGGAVFCTVTGRRVGSTFPVPGGLWRSIDRGNTWMELTATLTPGWPGDAAVHPADPNVIYLGLSSVPGRNEGGIWKTVDGGKTWKKSLGEESLPLDMSSYAHALFLTMDPVSPDTVYAGITTHGLFVTRNAGKTWTEVPGIPFAGCQRVAFDPARPGTLWVTTFGGGVWRGPAP